MRLKTIAVPAALAVFIFGCSNPTITNTKRTAVEELILSTAADRAVTQIDSSAVCCKKVFIDFSNLKCEDDAYVKGYVRQKIGSYGGIVVSDRKQAEIVAEVICGALGTDHSSWLLGLPQMAVPVPLAGTVSTPEIAFYKSDRQWATGKIGINLVDAKTSKQLSVQSNLLGQSYYHRYSLLGIPWNSTDVPKLK